jgi:hypothetical protein
MRDLVLKKYLNADVEKQNSIYFKNEKLINDRIDNN